MHTTRLLNRRPLRVASSLAVALLATSPLLAQAVGEGRPDSLGFARSPKGAEVRCIAIPAASHVALVLALRVGAEDREILHTLAVALGSALAPAGASTAGEGWQVRLLEDALQIAGLVPAADAPAALARLCSLLDGRTPLTDEALVVAISRARLLADDHVNVLPGPQLEARARRVLGLRGPGYGWPEHYEFAPAIVRERLRRTAAPENAALVALGGGDVEALRTAFASWTPNHAAGGGEVVAPPTSRPTSAADDAIRVHERVDAPFVSVAARAVSPDSTRYPAFLVAVEILRARAFAAFRAVRGGEMQARFPFVAFDPWEGTPLVAIQRRGKNGEELEGPQSEVRALLKRLAAEPPMPEEVARAGVTLGRTLWLPPYTGAEAELAREPRLLLVRAVTLAAAWSRKWPGDLTTSVQNVDTGLVRAVLADLLREDALVWSALVPRPAGVEGNPRR